MFLLERIGAMMVCSVMSEVMVQRRWILQPTFRRWIYEILDHVSRKFLYFLPGISYARMYSMLGQLAWVLELVFLLVALWLLLVGAALHTRCRRLFPLVDRRERSWGVGRCPWHAPLAILHAHLPLSGQLNPRVESSPRSITCYQRQSVSKTQRLLHYYSRIFEFFNS